jgi:hypothetical protein
VLGADYPHPSGNLRSLKGWIRSDFISAAWLRLAPFSEAACDFGVRAAAAKRQALIEREPDVGDGFNVKVAYATHETPFSRCGRRGRGRGGAVLTFMIRGVSTCHDR